VLVQIGTSYPRFITAYNYTLQREMPWRTPIDRVFNQKVLFYAFVGIIVGATAITLFADTRIGNPELRKDKVFDPKSHGWIIGKLGLLDRS
jgi:hypothetical protein